MKLGTSDYARNHTSLRRCWRRGGEWNKCIRRSVRHGNGGGPGVPRRCREPENPKDGRATLEVRRARRTPGTPMASGQEGSDDGSEVGPEQRRPTSILFGLSFSFSSLTIFFCLSSRRGMWGQGRRGGVVGGREGWSGSEVG